MLISLESAEGKDGDYHAGVQRLVVDMKRHGYEHYEHGGLWTTGLQNNQSGPSASKSHLSDPLLEFPSFHGCYKVVWLKLVYWHLLW